MTMLGSSVVATGAKVYQGKGSGSHQLAKGAMLVARVNCKHEGMGVLPRKAARAVRALSQEENHYCHNVCMYACEKC